MQEAVCGPVKAAESDKVPEVVLDVVRQSLAQVRSIRRRLDMAIQNLDAKLGGRGRYEYESLVNMRGEIAAAMAPLREFRERAPHNGVDAGRVLDELGGLDSVQPSAAARSWLDEQASVSKEAAACVAVLADALSLS